MEDDPFHIIIVGYGEIARLAHLPVLQSRSDSLVIGLVDTTFSEEELVSTNSVSGQTITPSPTILKFAAVNDAFEYFGSNIDAVSICTPQTATLSVARDVLKIATSSNESKLLGILLEKPPGEDVDDLKQTIQYGRSHGISMFTACHTTVCPARKVVDSWLFSDAAAGADCTNKSKAKNTICRRRLDSIHIIWKENVRKWHPGQVWISKECGGGVTDMLFNPISLIVSLFGLSFSSLPTTDLDENISGESIDQNRTIRLIKADLVRPCNWEAPISGCTELLMTVPLNDSTKGMLEMEVRILADFAFDYEPSSDYCNSEEIWNIEFVESVPKSDGSNHPSLTLKDGGAQAYIGSQKVTTEPTAEYPLRPEYEALYDQFLDLLQSHRSKSVDEAPSVVDCTTLAILKEIIRLGKYTVGPRFDF
mmetsp:Transcript_16106/g.29183  ORF Transcript_16106/g.29183 Transcript_16106/m.29183 type:complete len:421 (+) Transcript_16106:29-1291(+)